MSFYTSFIGCPSNGCNEILVARYCVVVVFGHVFCLCVTSLKFDLVVVGCVASCCEVLTSLSSLVRHRSIAWEGSLLVIFVCLHFFAIAFSSV